MLLLDMRGAPCALLSLLVCLLPSLLLFLLCLFNRFVDSNLYLAFYSFLAEAALGHQVVKLSISFYAGQRSLLFFAEQGIFQFGLAAGVCGRLQGLGGLQMRPVVLWCDQGQARRGAGRAGGQGKSGSHGELSRLPGR